MNVGNSNIDYPNLGKNIRGLRKAFGETQLDLAYTIGAKGPNVISQYESGGRIPERDYLTRIAKHYRITEFELLHGDFSNMRNLTSVPVNDPAYGMKMMSKMFPLICSPEALENSHFNEAYRIHTKFIDAFASVENFEEHDIEHDIERCLWLYQEASEEGVIEAVANHLWWLMFLGFLTVYITPRLVENLDSKEMSKITAKDVFDGLLPCFDETDSEKEFDTNNDRISYLEECEVDMIVDIIRLKRTKEYSDLGDYYLAWRYKFGLLTNTLSMEMNSTVGDELLLSFRLMGNKYCKDFFER